MHDIFLCATIFSAKRANCRGPRVKSPNCGADQEMAPVIRAANPGESGPHHLGAEPPRLWNRPGRAHESGCVRNEQANAGKMCCPRAAIRSEAKSAWLCASIRTANSAPVMKTAVKDAACNAWRPCRRCSRRDTMSPIKMLVEKPCPECGCRTVRTQRPITRKCRG